MAWVFKTLKSDRHDFSGHHHQSNSPETRRSSKLSGVVDDLSDLGKAIKNQFRGVFSCLGPASKSTGRNCSSSKGFAGIRNDFAEIGDGFKSGFNGFSNLASMFLEVQDGYYDDDDDDDGVPGINDEVIDFVKDIAMQPECWTDFPVSLDIDYKMSETQKEHAFGIEVMVPTLATLRHKLRNYMSREKFWMIYFIMLLPRLDGEDYENLATPKIVDARYLLLQKLHNKDVLEESHLDPSQEVSNSSETDRYDISSQNEDLAKTAHSAEQIEIDDRNTEKFSEEAENDTSTSAYAHKPFKWKEDISWYTDNDTSSRLPSSFPAARNSRASSPNGSSDWVQLNVSSEIPGSLQNSSPSMSRKIDAAGEESSDWLLVDEYD